MRATFHVMLGLLCLGAGCGEDGAQAGVGAAGASANAPALRCTAGEPIECACPGGGTAVQTCDASGTRVGPCTGCPDVVVPAVSAPPATTPADGVGDGVGDGDGDGVTGGAADAGAASGDEPPDLAPTASAPGTSCGVGLPTLCALGSEKCCVRSLSTDTCIATDEACTCELSDCDTMEATCDGPEDCEDGQVCCGTFETAGGGARYVTFTCAAQCSMFGSQRQACHQDSAACPPELVCANSQLLTNVQVCIDAASIQQ